MPIIIGWLAGVITQVFVAFFSETAKAAGKRLLVIAAALALIVSLTAAFFTAIDSVIDGISGSLPSEVVTGMALFLPNNIPACISAIITTYVLRFVYTWNIDIIKTKLL